MVLIFSSCNWMFRMILSSDFQHISCLSSHREISLSSLSVRLQTQKVGCSLSYKIHYWIGSQSSQDEQGAAAVYTIQLDEALGGTPIQYREAQNHESDAFKGYFKQGIMWVNMWSQFAVFNTHKQEPWNYDSVLCSYNEGGMASGMKHVETNTYDVKRLLHVKGKKRVTANEVRSGLWWWWFQFFYRKNEPQYIII